MFEAWKTVRESFCVQGYLIPEIELLSLKVFELRLPAILMEVEWKCRRSNVELLEIRAAEVFSC
jgi:hypothetical protein